MLRIIHPSTAPNPRARRMMVVAGENYSASDRPIFLAGYSELCRIDLNGQKCLEICSGQGALAANLAREFPELEVIGIDRCVPNTPEVKKWLKEYPGLSYIAGDAFDLSRFSDNSLQLVWGQAALHHLANDPEQLFSELMRVIKPGGRVVFIYEPLGHNWLVSAVRAIHIARHQWVDESNLYFSQIEQMADADFVECTIQVFNIFGYLLKIFSNRYDSLFRFINGLDSWLFRTYPKLLRYAANCNLIFVKRPIRKQ